MKSMTAKPMNKTHPKRPLPNFLGGRVVPGLA
jgi:hypothetical protein